MRNPVTLISRVQGLSRLLLAMYLTNGKHGNYPAGIYLFKVNSTITRAMFQICLKLVIKAIQRRQ